METNNSSLLKNLIIFLFMQSAFDVGTLFLNISLDNLPVMFLSKIIFTIYILILNKYITKTKISLSFSFSKEVKKLIFLIFIIEIICCIAAPHKIIESFAIGLMASIPEEYLFRGIILGTLLKLFKNENNIKSRIWFPILISSFIFSLEHLYNLSGQSLSFTFAQMIQVFGMGIMFACLYIRTNNLTIPIIAHFTIDTLVSFIENPSEEMVQSNLSIQTIGMSFIIMMMYIIIGISIIKTKVDKKQRS